MFALSPASIAPATLLSPATVSPPVSTIASLRAGAVTASAIAPASNASAEGVSVPFLVQALSQNENEDEENDDEIALASSFAHFAPAAQYDTFLGYSIVKYRPSDAGLPSLLSAVPAATEEYTQISAAIASEYNAYNTTQSRNHSNLVAQARQFLIAG